MQVSAGLMKRKVNRSPCLALSQFSQAIHIFRKIFDIGKKEVAGSKSAAYLEHYMQNMQRLCLVKLHLDCVMVVLPSGWDKHSHVFNVNLQ